MIYRDTVKPEWVDYNGHLRDAFYMLIYSLATDAFMDRIGLDEAGRRARQRTLYTLEALGMLPVFGAIYAGDDVERQKPDPEAVIKILRDLGHDVRPTECRRR